jgi:membrane protease YdiL (CAAX protease family)
VTISKRAALGVSLGAILLFWGWVVLSAPTGRHLPARFDELVWRIVRTKLLVLAAVYFLLRLGGERFDALGFRSHGWPRHVAIGLGFGLAMFVALNVALSSVLDSLLPGPGTRGPSILSFFHDPRNLLVWLPIGVIGGGMVEEIQRIFVLTRFQHALGRAGLALGVALGSAMFGFEHLYQGWSGAVSNAVSGAVLALLYLRRRSALEPIAAHAFADVLAMLAATFLAR